MNLAVKAVNTVFTFLGKRRKFIEQIFQNIRVFIKYEWTLSINFFLKASQILQIMGILHKIDVTLTLMVILICQRKGQEIT